MLLYYITDRSQFPGDETARRRRLLETIRHAVGCGVDYIQLREKDLAAGEFERLAGEVAGLIRNLRTGNSKLKTGFLINSRTDVALACGANGVQLRSNDISAIEVRRIWAQSSQRTTAHAVIGVSCHTPDEVSLAAKQGADFAVFGPVFEKNTAPGVSPQVLIDYDRLAVTLFPCWQSVGSPWTMQNHASEPGRPGLPPYDYSKGVTWRGQWANCAIHSLRL